MSILMMIIASAHPLSFIHSLPTYPPIFASVTLLEEVGLQPISSVENSLPRWGPGRQRPIPRLLREWRRQWFKSNSGSEENLTNPTLVLGRTTLTRSI
ncbi:hypothetical protein GE09DRAFT_591720 [Coniochaeta sp. 2T2.1]|nr:hypothetical protein GE09DRAFT_591720 [Coniochaeta sp. 2T2.1]